MRLLGEKKRLHKGGEKEEGEAREEVNSSKTLNLQEISIFIILSPVTSESIKQKSSMNFDLDCYDTTTELMLKMKHKTKDSCFKVSLSLFRLIHFHSASLPLTHPMTDPITDPTSDPMTEGSP